MNITYWRSNKDTLGNKALLDDESLATLLTTPQIVADKNKAPGWSPAHFNGRRAKKNCAGVSCAVLDYDNANETAPLVCVDQAIAWWEGLKFIVHTTHSHTDEKHKFRVVFPLSREVTPAEFEIVIAWLYERSGAQVDQSTKDCSRFWYLPSKATEEAPFFAQVCPGALLDVDSIINAANQANETNEPPGALKDAGRYYNRTLEAIRRAFAAAPHGTRNNLVAREAYSLGGVIDQCGVAQSTAELDLLYAVRAAGWQPYNEANEHATIRRQLAAGCARPRTIANMRTQPTQPSQPAPVQDAPASAPAGGVDRNAPAVRSTESFVFDEWKNQLNIDKKGKIQSTLLNATLFLRNLFELAFDEFSERIMLKAPPPYEAPGEKDYPRAWNDNDDIAAAVWLESEYRVVLKRHIVADAAACVAAVNAYHPVKQYLAKLVWDRKPRVQSWLVDFLGADAGAYPDFVRDAGRCFLVSAVARVMKPGCKVDTMLVLRGHQGAGKSTAFKILFNPWFTDEIADFGSRDAAVQCKGVWCAELAELSSLSRGETEKIKAFTSRATDRYVQKYEKHPAEHPRQCVFGGTTNANAYLNDETGARRFWPIDIGAIDTPALAAARDQLWAEAAALYAGGAPWWLVTEQTHQQQAEATANVRHVDEWQSLIERYIKDSTADFFSMHDLLGGALGVEPSKWTQADQNRVSRIMQFLGYPKARRVVQGLQKRGWDRPLLFNGCNKQKLLL